MSSIRLAKSLPHRRRSLRSNSAFVRKLRISRSYANTARRLCDLLDDYYREATRVPFEFLDYTATATVIFRISLSALVRTSTKGRPAFAGLQLAPAFILLETSQIRCRSNPHNRNKMWTENFGSITTVSCAKGPSPQNRVEFQDTLSRRSHTDSRRRKHDVSMFGHP